MQQRRVPVQQRRVPAAAIASLVVWGALACAPAPRPPAPAGGAPRAMAVTAVPATFSKPLSFAILEDYDKGQALVEVERDFQLMKELGVTTWRGSFGWDDYEPSRGHYDFEWLHRFAELAERHGITLRPYIGYTPEWAAAGRTSDESVWNDPPKGLDDWDAFVRALASAMQRHSSVRSYEIYNEENVKLWWDGTADEYAAVLARGVAAVRDAHPAAEVLLGGMVWPDTDWLETACAAPGGARLVDVVPFHAYPETWTPESVVVENYLGPSYRGDFLETVDGACGGAPVWINETGYATTPGRSELDQARWWARAIATFAADRRVEHVGIYEIKDLDPASPVIGDAPNYHLGLTRVDRTPKLAFHTVRLLTRLLGADTITVADAELGVTVTAGRAGELYHHLFRLPDGRQLLVVWDKRASPTLRIVLRARGTLAVEWALDGTSAPYRAFDGRVLDGVALTPGAVRIFELRR